MSHTHFAGFLFVWLVFDYLQTGSYCLFLTVLELTEYWDLRCVPAVFSYTEILIIIMCLLIWGYLSEGLQTVCVFISCPLSLSHSFLWLYLLLFSCFLDSDCFSCCLVVSSMKSLTQAVPTQPALSQTKISWLLLRSPTHTSTLFLFLTSLHFWYYLACMQRFKFQTDVVFFIPSGCLPSLLCVGSVYSAETTGPYWWSQWRGELI